MTITKFLFGAAAGVLVAGTAQAADLPIAPEPIDYVRVCDAFGAGFYYIPGTDTCLSVRGRVRAEYRYYDSEFSDHWRDYNSSMMRARGYLYMDARTNTEFGLLRAYNEIYVTTNSPGSTGVTLEHSFVQFGGFTFGKTQSFYDFVEYSTFAFAWKPGVSDEKLPVGAYTLAFGNGFSSTLSLEAAAERRMGIDGYSYGGAKYPDLVANIRIDQGWGSAQIMGALHQVWPAYDASYTPESELGYAVGAGVVFNLPFAAGASVNLTGTYTRGATSYAGSDIYGPFGTNGGGVYDAALDASGDLELSSAWSVSGGFGFDFTPTVGANIQAGYLDYQNDASFGGDFKNYDLQGNITWTPVKGLLFGVETDYKYIDNESVAGLDDGSVWSAEFRAQRTF
ncbi:porin [Amorphus sp. 3PC139-8]|uniref:porin n=1 Tax=Amorphus sp. 3PC139-8 TaxID=2735676 RepID=UPI00345CC57D